jgi:hypothetical protein
MKVKKVIGGLIFILGIVMVIYSIHSMQRINQAKGDINSLTGPFGDKKGAKYANKALTSQASKYDTDVMILLVSGIVCVALGGSVALMAKKRSH